MVMRGEFDLVQSESQVYVIGSELVIDSFRPEGGLQWFSAYFGNSTFLKTNITKFAVI